MTGNPGEAQADADRRGIDALACKLRAAAFPDAPSWPRCAQDTRERWLAAARAAYVWRHETRGDAL